MKIKIIIGVLLCCMISHASNTNYTTCVSSNFFRFSDSYYTSNSTQCVTNYLPSFYCSICSNKMIAVNKGDYYESKHYIDPCTNCNKITESYSKRVESYELELLETGTTNKIRIKIPIVTNNIIYCDNIRKL